ncbi:4-aminobutyrate aminotransferase family protein [Bradyrhizobium sp. YR681]|uniref:(R)-1-hydroxy-2-aminoethylphosphonate ammonia-lyase n=1 Tax=Bradyrhizobium sp. YR681 TaxID=1144344 RepID=UPI000270EEF4|nr:aspartate aminotransferase family protein [Bradyrhizobium sp. YR681]EJN12649.1 4-aminobutyrate aminotransferase family protein [Bradyrhizobium sp. YR681]
MSKSGMSASEGDVNLSAERRSFQERHLNAETRSWLDEDERWYLRQSLSTPCLNVATAAEGSHIVDLQGRRILDFHGNSVHQVGYGHPRVVAAIKSQLDTLPFCPRRYTNKSAIDLARRLAELAPAPLEKVLLAPSGSAAIGMALKLARYATGRHKTLSMWDAFHGANLDAVSIGGEALFRRGVGPLLPGTEHVPPPGLAARFFGQDGRAHERLADYIDYVLEVQGDVAAVIAEPMRWTTVELPPPGFWPRVRASCDRHGALLIFDEVPSCLGRTGTMFVCEQAETAPDILVLGKGLGGGIMPMAAIVARADLDVVPEGALGHYTHEKSPVGCAAALATLDVIAEEGLLAAANVLGAHALERLRSMADRYPLISEVRGAGLYLGVEIGRRDAAEANALAERLLYRCLEAGLSFKLGGGNVVTLCPPLTISRADLDRALDILEAAMSAL